jgi:serine protease
VTSRVLAPVPTMICAAAMLLTAVPAHAQDPTWTSPYPLLMTPQRAEALVQAAHDRLTFVPGEVIIKFREGVALAGQQRALDALRSRPAASDLKWRGGVAVLRDPIEQDPRVLAARLALQPEVEYAEPNYINHLHKTPNDPGFSEKQWNFSLLDLPRAWDINDGGSADVTVAVLDSGLTTVSQTFAFPTWNGRAIQLVNVPYRISPEIDASRLTDSRDFVFWDGPVLDMQGHGTHVASTVGEDTDNGVAEAGIAYNVKLMPLKVCYSYWDVQFVFSAAGIRGYAPLDIDGCDSASIAEAIRYAADHGAHVINMSLGGTEPSATQRDALRYAVSKGVFIAISAGNSFEENNPTNYPAAFAPEIDGVVAVGAVGRSEQRAYYSSTGNYVEIAAPGGDFSDGGYNGVIWQASLNGDDFDPATIIVPRFDRYVETPEQGTSMAAPHIAGVAALIYSQGVTNPAAIERLIESTAKDVGDAGKDSEFGYGLVQPRVALRGLGLAR